MRARERGTAPCPALAAVLAALAVAGSCGVQARGTRSEEPLRFRREGDWLKFKVRAAINYKSLAQLALHDGDLARRAGR